MGGDSSTSSEEISQRLLDMAVSESTRSTKFSIEALAAVNSSDAYPKEFQAIASQLAFNVHGKFVLKSSPNYPQFDQFRKVVIDLFIAGNERIVKKSIMEAAEMKLGREIPEDEFEKVLGELCKRKGVVWTLRSAR